jgi:AraC family ethanolamine operon transcriptional activator
MRPGDDRVGPADCAAGVSDLTGNLAGTGIQHAASEETVAGGAGVLAASAGNLHTAVIEAAVSQAAMQPWIEMDCYQLGRGRRLGKMGALNLGCQQIVRECQDVAVQKLGVTPANLCTVSVCTPNATFRFSELRASGPETLFFMPGNYEFDLYVPSGAQTSYVSFNQDEFLAGARALNPDDWEREPSKLLAMRTARKADFNHLVENLLQNRGQSALFKAYSP